MQETSFGQDVLNVERVGDVWTFTLGRPDKLNALNADIVDALLHAVTRADAEKAKVMVFRGAGKGFCAGFDLSGFEAQSEGDLVLRFVRIEMLLQAVAATRAMTIALAHGKVFGAGVDLVAVCKRRIAAPETTFRMPGLKFGLVLGTRRFGEIVGKEAARETLENVSSFDAERATQMGFLSQILPQEAWQEVVDQASSTAALLTDQARSDLYRVLGPVHEDADLAALTRSAARFGIKDRLRSYLAK
nr:enoyl-CoA hydratase/isomerase family protein [Pseudorhodoferax soli]